MAAFPGVLARDIMRGELVTAEPGQSLAELRHLLIESHVSGVPVMDAGRLVGIVSRSDLVRVAELVEALDGEVAQEQWHEQQTDGFSHSAREGFRGFRRHLCDLRVKDAMRTQVVTCALETPVQKVAAEMVLHHVHRVVVVEGEKPIGIVTTLDIAALVAKA